jgi:hypothetical protein
MRFSTALSERRRRQRANALRTAVGALPVQTKRAILAAIEEDEELILGAYTDRRGRVCPMLAAHRRGARAGVGSFAGAWDAFGRACRPRLATDRELDILKALLEESVFASVRECPPGAHAVDPERHPATAPSTS